MAHQTRTVATKFSIEGLYVSTGGLCICAGRGSALTKIQLIYSVSCFNLGGLGVLFRGDKTPKAPAWRRECTKPEALTYFCTL